MCHQPIQPAPSPQRDAEPEQNADSSAAKDTPAEEVPADPPEHQERGRSNENEEEEHPADDAPDLCFQSAGDFCGFADPVPSSSHDPPGHSSPPDGLSQGEETRTDSPPTSPPGAGVRAPDQCDAQQFGLRNIHAFPSSSEGALGSRCSSDPAQEERDKSAGTPLWSEL